VRWTIHTITGMDRRCILGGDWNANFVRRIVIVVLKKINSVLSAISGVMRSGVRQKGLVEYSPQYADIYAALEDYVSRGGERSRDYLSFLCSQYEWAAFDVLEAVSGNGPLQMAMASIAFEGDLFRHVGMRDDIVKYLYQYTEEELQELLGMARMFREKYGDETYEEVVLSYMRNS